MNEIRTTAWDVQAGDVMWDPNGPITIVEVARISDRRTSAAAAAGADPVEYVRMGVQWPGVRGTVGTTWEFDADAEVRLVSRAVSATGS